jgi:hypothetical protein
MRQKKKNSLMLGGGGTRWRPKPSSSLPSGGFRSHKKVVNIGWCRQTSKLAVGSKPEDGPHVGSHVACANQPNFRQFLNNCFLKSTYLFPVSCEIKYAAYIVNSHYISCGEGGKLPQSASLHSRDSISCESRDQEQEQSRPLQLIVNSMPLLFSRQKYCCTMSAYLASPLQIEVAFQD